MQSIANAIIKPLNHFPTLGLYASNKSVKMNLCPRYPKRVPIAVKAQPQITPFALSLSLSLYIHFLTSLIPLTVYSDFP